MCVGSVPDLHRDRRERSFDRAVHRSWPNTNDGRSSRRVAIDHGVELTTDDGAAFTMTDELDTTDGYRIFYLIRRVANHNTTDRATAHASP